MDNYIIDLEYYYSPIVWDRMLSCTADKETLDPPAGNAPMYTTYG